MAGVREDREEKGPQHRVPEAKADGHAMDVLYREVRVLRRRTVVLVSNDELGHRQFHRAHTDDRPFNAYRFALVSGRERAIPTPSPPENLDADLLAYLERHDWRNNDVQRYDVTDACSTRHVGWGPPSFLRVDCDGVHTREWWAAAGVGQVQDVRAAHGRFVVLKSMEVYEIWV